MTRVNPMIDELHDQLMVVSMRAAQNAQRAAIAEAQLEKANAEIEELRKKPQSRAKAGKE